MKHPLFTALTLAALGCAPRVPPAAPRTETPMDMHAFSIPPADPSGPPRQVRVLHDDPAVKLVAIRLRGVDLPPHQSDFAVVIQAVAGAGEVVVGDRREPLDGGRGVVLPPRAVHAVTRAGEGDLVLLVTHVKGAAAR